MKNQTGADAGHLDPLALDALRAGTGTREAAAHAADCATCRTALAELALLEAALKSAQPAVPEVPRELELRILRGYRESLRAPGPAATPNLLRRWAFPALGAAAAAALLLTINPVRLGDRAGSPPVSPPPVTLQEPEGWAAPESGRGVDIVDAFRLARALRDGRQTGPAWDADGNGLVDQADARLLARRAVAL